MKVIIAGSRTIVPEFSLIDQCIMNSGFHEITEIVEGEAQGVDITAAAYAAANSIPVKKFPADWDKYGNAAGPIRNRQMAQYADACILIWDGHSRGSSSMKREASRAGIPIYEHIVI